MHVDLALEFLIVEKITLLDLGKISNNMIKSACDDLVDVYPDSPFCTHLPFKHTLCPDNQCTTSTNSGVKKMSAHYGSRCLRFFWVHFSRANANVLIYMTISDWTALDLQNFSAELKQCFQIKTKR